MAWEENPMKTKEKVIIVGSAGHAKAIIDIIRSSGQYKVAGYTSPEQRLPLLGAPYLGQDAQLSDLYDSGISKIFLALGDNKRRLALTKTIKAIGFELINVISPGAYVSPSVKLGSGIAVMPGAVINPDSVIGDLTIINTGATVDHDCLIEPACHIAPGCNLAGNVKLGEGVFLGIGCKVIPKIQIGSWAVVGAGAVVIRDLPANCVAVGVPAKIVKGK